MAAESASAGGAQVDLYDAMPSVGRKLLLAGKGGLNLTHSEPLEPFLARYDARLAQIKPLLDSFGPDALRALASGLGIEPLSGLRDAYSPPTSRPRHCCVPGYAGCGRPASSFMCVIAGVGGRSRGRWMLIRRKDVAR